MTSIHISRRRADGDDELEEALSLIDMEGWLDSEGVDYKLGRGHSGVQINLRECPFCGHDKWKTYLNAETGLGKCFVCEEGLNRWKIIKACSGLVGRALIDHIKGYAKSQGWVARKTSTVAVSDAGDLIIPQSIALPHDGRNLKYLDNRGITKEYSHYFNLRFSQKGVFNYMNHHGRPAVQHYANRVIIPVFDMQGELVSFQGRDITGSADLKYLFPPGFASTGAHLYNGQNAIGAKRLAIGEGAFDVAAIKIAVDGDMAMRDMVPVGTFGKHMSFGDEDSQLAKLVYLRTKGLEEVTFVWDGEPKAIVAAIEAAMRVRGVGLRARVAVLPDGCDPNEIPADVLRRCIWNATTIDKLSAIKLLMKFKS